MWPSDVSIHMYKGHPRLHQEGLCLKSFLLLVVGTYPTDLISECASIFPIKIPDQLLISFHSLLAP